VPGIASTLTPRCCSIWVYDCSTWARLSVLHKHGLNWRSMAFLSSGDLVSGAFQGTFVIWNTRAGKSRVIVQEEWEVSALAASPHVFASGRASGLVEIWTHTGIALHELEGHASNVFDLAMSPEGDKLVSASWDGTARVWDVLAGTALHVHDICAGPVTSVSVGSHGLLAVALQHASELRFVHLLGEGAHVVHSVQVDWPFKVRCANAHLAPATTAALAGQEVYFSQDLYAPPLSKLVLLESRPYTSESEHGAPNAVYVAS